MIYDYQWARILLKHSLATVSSLHESVQVIIFGKTIQICTEDNISCTSIGIGIPRLLKDERSGDEHIRSTGEPKPPKDYMHQSRNFMTQHQ